MATVAACGEDSTAPAGPLDVTIQFDAAVNGVAFACGNEYQGVGASSTTIRPTDFRYYVHDVALLRADGTAEPLTLTQDGQWQRDNLALLDFEDASGACVNGTAATNTSVRGQVQDGEYTGLQFTLGVPFSMNHQDQTAAQAPLDLTGLFWAWNGGYKFARIDHVSDAQPDGWFVHLGSTGCTPNDSPATVPTSCANQHRVQVRFEAFNHAANTLRGDLGSLLSQSDLTQSTGAKGCMSFPGDPECHAVMNAWGLDYEGSASAGQRFFSVR